MGYKNLIAVLLIATVSMQCKFRNSSNLDHIDDPSHHGGDQAMPWHFHTGAGFRTYEKPDPVTGAITKTKIRCDVMTSKAGDGCQEQVFYFTPQAIEALVDAAYQGLEKEMTLHAGLAASAAALATYTTKGAVVAVYADPTKISAVIGALAVGTMWVVVTYQGYKAAQKGLMMSRLNNLFANEQQYVGRCQHVSKDFYREAKALNVQFGFGNSGFGEGNGTFIDAIHYQNSAKEEMKLYQDTMDYAVKNGLTIEKAYNDYFKEKCGQLPAIYPTPAEKTYGAQWVKMPAIIARNAIAASTAMKLDSTKSIEMLNFDGNDFNSEGEQTSAAIFLASLQKAFLAIDRNGSEEAKKRLAKFRRDYRAVYIQTRYGNRDLFSSHYTYYDQAQHEDGKDLFINAIWWATSANYKISLQSFFLDELGIDPKAYGVP